MTAALPPRVQRRRAKGYRLQAAHPGAIVVTRPGKWGNPFEVEDALDDDPTLTTDQARETCARMYRRWLDGEITLTDPELIGRRTWILDHIDQLAGHPLACWCPLPEPGQADHCHADVLLDLANKPAPLPRRTP
jgi:hypothetical protein